MHEVRRSLAAACERGEFRVAHYSIQRDHAHLIVEARGREALARGMKSIAARLARAVNRVFSRSGPVLDGRFHHRVLRTPREVRNALAYVLLNARRHLCEAQRRPPSSRPARRRELGALVRRLEAGLAGPARATG
jgi:REP element-mobilizing transposase RayT